MPNTPPQLVRTASGSGWTNPSAITGTASQAFHAVIPHGSTTPLIGTNAPLSVPAGVTINGIIVSANGQADTDSELGFSGIQLVLGGVPIGTAKNPGNSDWLDIPEPFTYGSGVDLWGASLTAANVNDPTFGFRASVANFSANGESAFVNGFTIQVFYSFGGGGGSPSNGGIPAPLNQFLIPAMIQTNQFSFYTLDPTNFNDPNSGSFYNWKVEDGIAGRTLTVNRVILSYRDLGLAKIMVALTGVTGPNDPTQPNTPVSSISPLTTIGTSNATGRICTLVLGLSLSAANQQLSVIRAANGGPVSITKARLEGKVETTTY